jgi:acyl carrier protein
MTGVGERVVACFRMVFPDWSEERIRSAGRDTDETWDSLATLTLVTVLEEELGIVLADDVVDGLDDFGAVLAAVEAATA